MALKKIKKTTAKKADAPVAVATIEPGPTGEKGTWNGYCVKCKEKQDFDGEIHNTKTGGRMAKGKCDVCGTTICRIMGKA